MSVVPLKAPRQSEVILETITPTMASKWLQSMVNNRTLSQSWYVRFLRATR